MKRGYEGPTQRADGEGVKEKHRGEGDEGVREQHREKATVMVRV